MRPPSQELEWDLDLAWEPGEGRSQGRVPAGARVGLSLLPGSACCLLLGPAAQGLVRPGPDPQQPKVRQRSRKRCAAS